MRNRVLIMGMILGILIVVGISTASAATVKTSHLSDANTKVVGAKLLIQEDPDISGALVVYRKTKYPGTTQWAMENPVSSVVYWKSIKTGTTARVTSSTALQYNPIISGSRVIWHERGTNGLYSLYVKNLATGATGFITSDCYGSDISGTRVIWTKYKNGRDYLYYKNLAIGTTRLVATADTIISPNISGTRVVWNAFYSIGEKFYSDIYVKNLMTGAIGRIGSHNTDNPNIDGTKVVWQEGENIYWKDLATGARGWVGNGNVPKISGNWAAWEDQVGSYLVIYAKNVVTGTTVKINQQIGGQFSFKTVISGHTVVWQDWRPYMFVDYWKNVLTGAWGRVQN